MPKPWPPRRPPPKGIPLSPTIVSLKNNRYLVESLDGVVFASPIGSAFPATSYSGEACEAFTAALAAHNARRLSDEQRIVVESFLTLCSILREPGDRLAVLLSWQSEGATRHGMQFAEEGQIGALTLNEWSALL